MKVIKYTDHLKLRLKVRKIPFDYPKEIYNNPDQEFIDLAESRSISIKKLRYNKKERNLMIAYEEKENEVSIITIHPISDEKIIQRIMNQRWRKNE